MACLINELRHTGSTNISLKFLTTNRYFLQESNTPGIHLIRLFAEQSEGDLQFTNNNGVEISLVFRQQYSINKSFSFMNKVQLSNL